MSDAGTEIPKGSYAAGEPLAHPLTAADLDRVA